ncbi:transcriptional regulator [Brevibacillus sp. TJ4]|uniref:transcriptional regulator n=1 Tax=Brevibacillus sp. TJ4 TaxID=3234853 RepID=UPI003BA26A6A
MWIQIAVISPEDFAGRITAYAETSGNKRFSTYYYRHPRESGSIVEQIEDCDVLLFAGPLPYYFARELSAARRIPSVYIPSDEYSLTLTLGAIYLHRSEGLQRLSVDIPHKDYIRRAAEELQLDTSRWQIRDYSVIVDGEGTEFDLDALLSFHRSNYESGRSNLVLTSVDYVYEQLREDGIPCVNLLVPEKSIRETVAKAASLGQMLISENAQIAIGLAAIEQRGKEGPAAAPEASIALQQRLLELGKEADASVQQLGLDQYIMYGTRGSVEHMTHNFQHMPAVGDISSLYDVTISMGFGFGLTAREAESNARIALFSARQQKEESSAFLVTHEKEVIGPLGARAKAYHLKSENQGLLEIAEQTAISIATINKLLSFVRLRRDNRFTATDLAEYLQVSRRSAERILKKLADKHAASRVGEEQPYQQGRPRAVYQIHF